MDNPYKPSSDDPDSELTPVELDDVSSPVPGFIRREGEYRNEEGQVFVLAAVAREDHVAALDEFSSVLRVWFHAVPVDEEADDIPELEEILSQMEDPESQKAKQGQTTDEAQFVAFGVELRGGSGTSAVLCYIDKPISPRWRHVYAGERMFVTVSATGNVQLGGVTGGPYSVPPARRQRRANRNCWIDGVQRSEYDMSAGWYQTWKGIV